MLLLLFPPVMTTPTAMPGSIGCDATAGIMFAAPPPPASSSTSTSIDCIDLALSTSASRLIAASAAAGDSPAGGPSCRCWYPAAPPAPHFEDDDDDAGRYLTADLRDVEEAPETRRLAVEKRLGVAEGEAPPPDPCQCAEDDLVDPGRWVAHASPVGSIAVIADVVAAAAPISCARAEYRRRAAASTAAAPFLGDAVVGRSHHWLVDGDAVTAPESSSGGPRSPADVFA